jgi:hypothetical protein
MADRKLGCVDITFKMCELTFRRVTNNTGTESVVICTRLHDVMPSRNPVELKYI